MSLHPKILPEGLAQSVNEYKSVNLTILQGLVSVWALLVPIFFNLQISKICNQFLY